MRLRDWFGDYRWLHAVNGPGPGLVRRLHVSLPRGWAAVFGARAMHTTRQSRRDVFTSHVGAEWEERGAGGGV